MKEYFHIQVYLFIPVGHCSFCSNNGRPFSSVVGHFNWIVVSLSELLGPDLFSIDFNLKCLSANRRSTVFYNCDTLTFGLKLENLELKHGVSIIGITKVYAVKVCLFSKCVRF